MSTNLFALGGIECLTLLFRYSLVAAIILCAASNPTAAATITNTWSYDPPLNVWSDQRFTVPQFDPSTGTLQRLEISVAMRTDGTIRLSSQCIQSKTVNYNYTNTFRLTRTNISMVAGTRSRGGLTLAPGETKQLGSQASRRTMAEQFFEPKLQSLIGSGTVQFAMHSERDILTTCVEGGCGCILDSVVNFDAGVDVELVYVFEPRPALAIERDPSEQFLLLHWGQSRGFTYILEMSADFGDWLPIVTNINLPPVGQKTISTQIEQPQFFRLKRSPTGNP